MIKDSGDRTEFETGAKRDMHAGKGRMDLLPWYGIMEVSKHCEEGALKYGEHNVDKGIPLHSLLDSAARHLAKYMVGMDDEDHLRAACWNLLWALNQRVTHPELDDRFCVKEQAEDKMPEKAENETLNHDKIIRCHNSECRAYLTDSDARLLPGTRIVYVNIAEGVVHLRCPYCDHITAYKIGDVNHE